MHWINIHTSTLDSAEFLCSPPCAQATWLKSIRYCVGQENGGVIPRARTWSDRDWQQLVRVTRREVMRESKLWDWEGDDLKIKFYPENQEREVQSKRSAAVSTHNKRRTVRDAEQLAEHGAEHPDKGKEGKETEGEGNPPPSNRPLVEEAIEYFARNGCDYTAQEVRDVWNSFEATIRNGKWLFGRNPVGDWRFAMETRLSDNRKKAAPGNTAKGHPSGWQDGDDELWWAGELALVEAAASGAWIGQDKKKAARMDAIIGLRKGRS